MQHLAVYEPDSNACGLLDVQLLVRYLGQRVPLTDLLDGSGVSVEKLYQPDTQVTLAQKLHIFSNALLCADEPGLGLKVGQQARFSDFGVLGYAVFSSSTLLEAMTMGFKYLRLAGPVLRKQLLIDKDLGYIRAEELIDLDTLMPFCCEYWFSAIQSLCEEVMQHPFPSHQLHFPYPAPHYASLYQEVFRCPVKFQSKQLEWQFSTDVVNQPLPTANKMTLQQCLKTCDEMLAKLSGTSTSLKDRITQRLIEQPGHYPSIEVVAQQLGMSSRTLRRKLTQEQTSYQQILDHVRFHLSRHYLCSTQLSIDEISERVGYSDSANFRHAFRKWSGDSPSHYRKSAHTVPHLREH